ncbi:ABC transporter permease [Cereibacter sp. SYSU M97828]|nr:ABC transporter permease [Cereibacter flavus]
MMTSARGTPAFLSLPAIILFTALLIVPMVMMVVLSFQEYDQMLGVASGATEENYLTVITDPYYQEIFLRTLGLAAATTLISILIGAPEAYILSRMSRQWRSLFLVICLSPLLISVVVRTLGWAMLFGRHGLINETLLKLGLIAEPMAFLYTLHGVVIAMVHVCVPFMVISVWIALQRLDPKVEAAALSLGASKLTVLRRIVFPQVLPGILSGSLIVFALCSSSFATPGIIGGRQLKVAATATHDEFMSTMNWPLGAALAIVLLIVNAAVMLSYNRIVERRYARISQ